MASFINLYTPQEFSEQLFEFGQHYDLQEFISVPQKKPSLKPKLSRICRFCGLGYPDTSFRNDSHIIPEFLGNRYLVSDFECDKCNHLFGTYENDLANYLGIERTVFRTNGKKNIPSFNSSDNKIVAKETGFFDSEFSIKIEKQGENDSFLFDETTNTYTIEFQKQPYRPMSVYKAMLKMALCLIDVSEVESYSPAFRFLTTKQLDVGVKEGLYLKKYSWHFTGPESPTLLLFRKKRAEDDVPTHVFCLYTTSTVLEIVPVFNKSDKKLYDRGNVHIVWCPPLSTEPCLNPIQFQENCTDFCSGDLYYEKSHLCFQVDPSEFSNLMAYDPATGEVKENVSKPAFGNMKAIQLVPAGFTIPLKANSRGMR